MIPAFLAYVITGAIEYFYTDRRFKESRKVQEVLATILDGFDVLSVNVGDRNHPSYDDLVSLAASLKYPATVPRRHLDLMIRLIQEQPWAKRDPDLVRRKKLNSLARVVDRLEGIARGAGGKLILEQEVWHDAGRDYRRGHR